MMKEFGALLIVALVTITVSDKYKYIDYSKHQHKPGVKSDKKCKELYETCERGSLCCDGLTCHTDQVCWNDYEQARKELGASNKKYIKMLGEYNELKRKQPGWKPIPRTYNIP